MCTCATGDQCFWRRRRCVCVCVCVCVCAHACGWGINVYMYLYVQASSLSLSLSLSLPLALPADSTPPSWLSGLMSVCRGSHDRHMTFTALETLLTLQSSLTIYPPLVGPEQSAQNFISLLIPNISTFTRDDQFVEVGHAL